MSVSEPKQMTASRGAVELAVEQFRSGTAGPVLMLHGAGNSRAAWPVEFRSELAQGEPGIRYDARDARE